MAAIKIISGLTIAVILAGIAINIYQPKLTEDTKLRLNTVVKRTIEYGKNFVKRFIEKPPREEANKTDFDNPEDALGKNQNAKDRLLTTEELAKYDGGAENLGIYLAILGKVYDVSKGAQHYKPGGGYAFFTGKDASKAYVTGDFTEEGLSDDVLDLKGDQLLGIEEWVKFYEKDYTYVGKLIGRFYDNNGEPTDYLNRVEEAIDQAKALAQVEVDERKILPPCNSEWSHDQGGRVWCSTMSGGIERSWPGVPRKLYKPGQENPRCVCAKNYGKASGSWGEQSGETVGRGRGDLDHPQLREYNNCHPEEESCKL